MPRAVKGLVCVKGVATKPTNGDGTGPLLVIVKTARATPEIMSRVPKTINGYQVKIEVYSGSVLPPIQMVRDPNAPRPPALKGCCYDETKLLRAIPTPTYIDPTLK